MQGKSRITSYLRCSAHAYIDLARTLRKRRRKARGKPPEDLLRRDFALGTFQWTSGGGGGGGGGKYTEFCVFMVQRFQVHRSVSAV